MVSSMTTKATLTAPSVADLDAVFKGFADPTRIRILSSLAAGELCVCDLVDILHLPQPTVSRHLAYLRRMGLVVATRDAKFAHYRLSNLNMQCIRTCSTACAPASGALARWTVSDARRRRA